MTEREREGDRERERDGVCVCERERDRERERLATILKTFSLINVSYTCSQSNSGGSKLEPSEFDWLQT